MRASFRREIVSIGKIHDLVRAFFDKEGIGNENLFAVDLAVEEIFTNMVKYNRGGGREIDVELASRNDRLTIRLIDHEVSPFDITREGDVDTDRPLEERPIGGLGLLLVKKLMDEVEYAYADRRSTITLVKRITAEHV